MDQIGMKRGKIEKKIWEKSPKNWGNLINAQDLIIIQGGFFPKNNKRTVSNKHAQGGFFPKK